MLKVVDAMHDVARFTTRVTTYHLIRPDRGLCFELCAIPHLQRARAASRKEVGDLLPSEVLLFLEVDK